MDVRSLYIELLAYDCLPKIGRRQDALGAFFTAASVRVNDPVCDPAGLCGNIQPDLDIPALRAKLEDAAVLADSALLHESLEQENVAVAKWGEIFGPDFPKADSGGGGGGGAGGGLAGVGGGGAALDLPERVVKDINQG